VGVICLLDTIWSWAIGFTLSGYSSFLIVALAFIAATAVLRSGWKDCRLAIATEVVALWMAFACSGNILTYLSATPALPLQDDLLASGDAALGFQWLVMYNWIRQHPGVGHILSICYASLFLELLVLGVWLSWRRYEQRIGEFFWIACLAILQTSILSALLPATSAFVHFGLPERATWLHDLEALRGGSNLHFALADLDGIVSFPSFHTVLAILVIYIARGTGMVGSAFIVWNAIMLFSIPSFGGHYLIDMVGGAVVLAISIRLVRGSALLQSH
jgi:hypothetical protein